MLYCVKLGWWVHGLIGEVVNGAKRIKSEKLREHHYVEGYGRCLGGKRAELDEDRNAEQMQEQVKRGMNDTAREVCSSVRVVGKNYKNVWRNDVVKDTVER